MTRRIVSIALPRLPIERWERAMERAGMPVPDDIPVALKVDGPHGPVVHAVNRTADVAGVRPGARVVDMRAICPGLEARPADPAGDREALERLALWARRWCPWTTVDGDRGVVMDTTGADHLWGGEAAMLRDIEARLADLGLSARLAAAPTWGAAWALARHGGTRAICRDAADLAPLPAAALRLEPETVLLLHRLGLKTVGDLMLLPRLTLARRFSRAPLEANPLLRLDQATGRLAEPLAPPETPEPLRVTARLPEPILDPTHHLPGLAEDLAEALSRRGLGARRLVLTVYRTDGKTRAIAAGTAEATRDPAHMAFLFRDRLERIDPGFGFDLLTLEAAGADPVAPRQPGLDREAAQGIALPELVDRLTTRFGGACLSQPLPRASHIPERAERLASPLSRNLAAPPLAARTDRPARLFDPPEEVRVLYAVPEGPPVRFLWRRRPHLVTRFTGPERIAPEWWRDRPGTRLRDYYRVEEERGSRLWLYREGLHGDGRGDAPRWFVHGVFA